MPQRLQMIGNLIEVICLTLLNAFFLITWMSFFASIPILISSVYGIGRIKRDIDKYHDGKAIGYIKYILGNVKKK